MSEEHTPSVSIIVPIYNVEKYLKECLNSCRKQTLKNIEIICVDDGSTDGSLGIVQKLAKKDKRIKCITKKNSGYGNTMNIGIDNAKGEYIGIVESDDFVAQDMFEVLYNIAVKKNVDIVKSDYYTFKTNKKGKREFHYEKTCNDPKFYNLKLIPKKKKEIFTFQMNTWTGIYRNSFLKQNNIRHNETPGASYQDNGFWFQTLSLANSIIFINRAFYYYRQDNPNSSINSRGKVFCMNEEYDFIFKFIMAHPTVKAEFINQYVVKKFFNYMYTYERISDEYKLEFLKRFSEEFNALQQSKIVNIYNIQNPWIIAMLGRIMDNYKLFYYEDAVFRMNAKLENAQGRLKKLEESNEISKGRRYIKRIKKLLRWQRRK